MLVDELKANSKLMIDYDSQNVVKKPPANQRCPCGANKAYKKCACAAEDNRRTEHFIQNASKKVKEEE